MNVDGLRRLLLKVESSKKKCHGSLYIKTLSKVRQELQELFCKKEEYVPQKAENIAKRSFKTMTKHFIYTFFEVVCKAVL